MAVKTELRHKPRPAKDGPVLATLKEACEFLRVSRTTIWRMLKRGELTPIRVTAYSTRVQWNQLRAISENRPLPESNE